MSHTVNDVRAPSDIRSPKQAVNPFLNDLLNADLCKKIIFVFSIFSWFFSHDFIIYIDFTHVTASNIETDDITN